MFGLAEIKKLNALPRVKAEDNHSRNCSYQGDADMGVVLHSAKLRNTVYLAGAKHRSSAAKNFIIRWNRQRSDASRNALVESYFD